MGILPQVEVAAKAANDWIGELTQRLAWHDQDKVYLALVATLHALRDDLPVPEAVFFGEYLTPLIRGFYYGGWHMTKPSHSAKTREGFLERVRDGVRHDPAIDAEQVARAVFALLAEHLPASELEDVKAATPKELRAFWPE